MPLIKRYPNRKLYDTTAKSYVTLDEITQMIRGGQDVQVIDHESGEDLTNLTFTQVILEQEKRSTSDFLPRTLLASLIRTGGDTLGSVRRSLQTGLGAGGDSPELAGLEEQVAQLIEQGRHSAEQVLNLDERMADILRLLNVPSQRDLRTLQQQVDALSGKLASLIAETEREPESIVDERDETTQT